MEAKKIEVKILLSSILLIILVETAVRFVLPAGLPFMIAVVGAIRLTEVLLICLILFCWGGGLSSIGLARDQLWPGFIRGLIWSAGFGLVVVIGMMITKAAGINPITLLRTSLPSKSSEVLVYFIVGGIVAPVAEEVVFRGVIYGFFRRWGVPLALVTSTLLFITAHSGSDVLPLTQMVGGVVFALAYEIEGCLMVPILIHSLGNMALFSLTLFFL